MYKISIRNNFQLVKITADCYE